MLTVTVPPGSCNSGCKASQVDALMGEFLVEKNEKGEVVNTPCRYYFIKPQIRVMLDEIKNSYNLSDQDAGNDKDLTPEALQDLFRSFVRKAPTGFAALEINKLWEGTKYAARSKISQLLGPDAATPVSK